MIEKALLAVIGLAALTALTLMGVAAAGFALFAVLTPLLGAAGAAGVLALVCILILGGAVLAVRGKGPSLPALQQDDSLAARAFDLARQHPMAAGGAALLATLAAGVLAVKNPKVIATALSAYLAGRSSGRH
ncbi:MAG: hypothetical protein Q8L59_04295 [Phenylobacterium sp.]|uniref:hypothetical protein n=1 Tax=Phenylobacterium sp. TaxID=1871053 RepID=UPI002733F6B3|nr:hypothetical protein [Phenylobacterium sp.]MDP1641380.1 hypothetical protein [Phenylobacterium sp.]MDP3115763.1 hypothetical protein [Phenylobacterium sp.]MDP3381977.1 hypothetical protein [Phenylobacterium sp.]